MSHDDARVRKQSSPVTRVMAAFAQREFHGKVEGAARSHKNGRRAGLHAGAVGGNKDVGGEQVLVRLAEVFEAR